MVSRRDTVRSSMRRTYERPRILESQQTYAPLSTARVRAFRESMTDEERRLYNKKYNDRAKSRPRKKQPYDRERERNSSLRKRYGIDLDRYLAMCTARGGKCDICSEVRPLVVDHCHATGRVRGLLCNGCNSTIGFARDNVRVLENAIAYLMGS